MTLFEQNSVTIVLSKTTNKALEFGDGRARNTVAHEFGHAILHQGPPMHRGVGSLDKLKWIPPYRSAEHQAKIFAPAFLVDDWKALSLGDETEVAIYFGLSLESAKIYLRELRRPEERRRVREKLRDFSQVLETSSELTGSNVHFLSEPCPRCRQSTLFPVRIKYMCKTCDGVFDHFQDGDPVGF